MSILLNLAGLALRPLVGSAYDALGVPAGSETVGAVVGFLTDHFRPDSRKLIRALEKANDRAWKALEVALQGESFWERCNVALAGGDEKDFRRQVRAFLDGAPLAELSTQTPEFRRQCLSELRAARRDNLLSIGGLDGAQLAKCAGAFAGFADPQKLLDAEWKALEQTADEWRRAERPAMAQLLSLRPPQGLPLLAVAVRYFFRREIETDEELSRGLAWATWERLASAQEAGFRGLEEALVEHAQRMEELLVEVQGGVIRIEVEVQQLGREVRELAEAVLRALEQRQMQRRELRPGDSLSIRNDDELQLVKRLVRRYRELSEEQRRASPATANGIGMLETAVGDFEAAHTDFRTAAALMPDPAACAEARHNAFRAALERRDWPAAFVDFQEAVRLDEARFAPFPLDKFRPLRILGAGGFGVAFLCHHRYLDAEVVVKTVLTDVLDRGLEKVFAEARVLGQLDHHAIIRLTDCGYADAETKARPFLVMEYFDGLTLEEHVRRHGPLSTADLLAVARFVASALKAAHDRGVLHRDVKPANLLVRQAPVGWQVKLIDFGLALRRTVVQSTLRHTGALDQTLAGSSVAGTLDYAAPEQMGKLKGVEVGPRSDVYGFARTCCFALFRTPQPTFQQWKKAPEALAELLGHCLAEHPTERPNDFQVVLDRLPNPSEMPKGDEPSALVGEPTVKQPAVSAPLFPTAAQARSDWDELDRLRQTRDKLADALEGIRKAAGWMGLALGPIIPMVILLILASGIVLSLWDSTDYRTRFVPETLAVAWVVGLGVTIPLTVVGVKKHRKSMATALAVLKESLEAVFIEYPESKHLKIRDKPYSPEYAETVMRYLEKRHTTIAAERGIQKPK